MMSLIPSVIYHIMLRREKNQSQDARRSSSIVVYLLGATMRSLTNLKILLNSSSLVDTDLIVCTNKTGFRRFASKDEAFSARAERRFFSTPISFKFC